MDIINHAERSVFLRLLDFDEGNKSFLYHYRLIRDALPRSDDLSLRHPNAPSVETFMSCIEAFSLPDKKKQNAVRESLIHIFSDLIQHQDWGNDTLSSFLSYAYQKGSIYADYELTVNKVRTNLNQYGLCTVDQLMKKKLAKTNFTIAYTRLRSLIERLPPVGGSRAFEQATMIALALETDKKKSVSYIKEAINRLYNSVERCRAIGQMAEYMDLSNHYYRILASTYQILGFQKDTSENLKTKYWRKSLKILENIYDEQQQEEKLNSVFARYFLYKEIGNEEKAQDLFAKWQIRKANQLKEAQDSLAKKRAALANIIKEDIANKKRQETELTAKPNFEGYTPQFVKQTHPTTDEVTYSPVSLSIPSQEMPREKTKVKSKGIADLSKAKRQPQKAIKQIEEIRSNEIKIEDLLKVGSKHYGRFCELFSIYEDDTQGVKAISISMHHASKLLDRVQEALNALLSSGSQSKGVDSSKGKGSHAKAQISNGIEKVVITLSKKSTLLPYQIRSLVDAFVKLGYYPHYLEDRLYAKGILHSSPR